MCSPLLQADTVTLLLNMWQPINLKAASSTCCVFSGKIIVCWCVISLHTTIVKWFHGFFVKTGRIRKCLRLSEDVFKEFTALLWMSRASVRIDLHIKYISNKTTSCSKPIVKSIVIGTKILWVLGLQSYCLCSWPVEILDVCAINEINIDNDVKRMYGCNSESLNINGVNPGKMLWDGRTSKTRAELDKTSIDPQKIRTDAVWKSYEITSLPPTVCTWTC